MKYKRAAGILLHPTSLPGRYGIGDLGPQAFRWVDWLASTGCGLWQVLPLGPTGYGDSPYQCFSAFAGNPYLVSPELLLQEGLLTEEDLADRPDLPDHEVDFGGIYFWKLPLLDQAYERFKTSASPDLRQELAAFKSSQAAWLEDFALFMAIKEAQGGGSWSEWPLALRLRHPEAMEQARADLYEPVERQIFRQFLFFRQWAALRSYVHEKGIHIIGDIPIFVAHDSADVWAHTELFYIDKAGQPTVVAGVPPDYFSPTGQLWGNPIYRWDVHAASGYDWWIDRFKAVLQMVDIVRLDHFRGFAGYWEVPGGSPTAEKGQWKPGPGLSFFQKLKEALGDLPIIAEDLGVITPDVVELRDTFGLPGMKVIQFAFLNDPSDPFLPHNYIQNCVVYTGTHDNDTAVGWFASTTGKERDFILRYLETNGEHIAWDMIRLIWMSVGRFALAPMQDFLELGNEARMNYPGKPSGNWAWRMPPEVLSDALSQRIAAYNELYLRAIHSPEPPSASPPPPVKGQ